MRKLTKAQKGDFVFDALAQASPDGLTTDELTAVTGMSAKKVKEGLSYVREMLAGLHSEPIVCLRDSEGGYRYTLAASSDAVAQYAHERLKIAAKQARNLLAGVLTPGMMKFGNPLHLRLLVKYVERVTEDLDELVATADEDVPIKA